MIARGLRVLFGAALALPVALVVVSPDATPAVRIGAVAMLLLAAWRPDHALIALAAFAPAGMVIAPEPARAAETLTWAFLTGWTLAVWRPILRRPMTPLGFPALAYVVAAIASWVTITFRESTSFDQVPVLWMITKSIAIDHLLFAASEPETWTLLLALAGVAMFLAATTLTTENPKLAGRVAIAIVVSMAVLSLVTLVASLEDWRANDHAAWFLERRYSYHLKDLNAAGSQYVLAGLLGLGLAQFHQRRLLWLGLVVAMVPGAWFAGSRTAAVSVAAVLLSAAAIQRGLERHWRPSRALVTGVATALAVVVLTTGVILARGINEQDTAGHALRMRFQFAETSARMAASAPVYGVGIGRYHARSREFMPPALRAVYGNENAHNYFAQQFAELGAVGGVAFLWLLAAACARGWLTLTASNRLAVALLAGCAGYLLTCLTGHPLLVPEAALPFWIALGALSGVIPARRHSRVHLRADAIAFAIILAVSVPAARAAALAGPTEPVERGFYDVERTEDGDAFRWTARHAITAVPTGSGFIRLTVQAPDGDKRPSILDIEIDGALMARHSLEDDDWHTFDIPARPRHRSLATNHRIDLRVDHTRNRIKGSGLVEPLGVMVGELRWVPAR